MSISQPTIPWTQSQRIDFTNSLPLNWDINMHSLKYGVPANAQIWGITILDWDYTFTNRIGTKTENDLQIPFQYMEKIPTWDKSANYASEDGIMGRFEGQNVYANSASQDFSIELYYHAEALSNDGAKTPWTLENIEVLTKRIQSLVYPQYDNNYGPPMKVLFNVGNIWRNVPLIVRKVSVESLAPFHIETGLPMLRKVSIDVRISYPDWQAMGQLDVYQAWSLDPTKPGNQIFAYEKLSSQYNSTNIGGGNSLG